MATRSQPDLAVALRLSITRTARRLRQEGAAGLSPSQGSALATIDRHGPLTPSELAARERIQRPTATRLVAKLEEGGLVARTADPADRRSCLIAATGAGHDLLAEIRGRKDAYLARRLRTLPAEDRATLDRATAILERLLEEEGA
ncbi:MAG: MarR family transcriptional regulator [Solirubrobacterales bacterium]|nr:MarR family transcriptional regulator [Solirubrobacterales bacterium]